MKEAHLGWGPCAGFALCGLFGVIIFSVMMAVFMESERLKCDAGNGVCPLGDDPLVDDCCVFWCCPGSVRSSVLLLDAALVRCGARA